MYTGKFKYEKVMYGDDESIEEKLQEFSDKIDNLLQESNVSTNFLGIVKEYPEYTKDNVKNANDFIENDWNKSRGFIKCIDLGTKFWELVTIERTVNEVNPRFKENIHVHVKDDIENKESYREFSCMELAENYAEKLLLEQRGLTVTIKREDILINEPLLETKYVKNVVIYETKPNIELSDNMYIRPLNEYIFYGHI